MLDLSVFLNRQIKEKYQLSLLNKSNKKYFLQKVLIFFNNKFN